MLREIIDSLGVGRPSGAATFVVMSTLQMGWKQVLALQIPLGGEESAAIRDADERVAGDMPENATSIDVINVQNGSSAEALVPVTRIPTNAPVALQVVSMKNESEKAVIVVTNPLEGPVIHLNNATESDQNDKFTVAPVEASTTSLATKSAATKLRTQTTEPPTTVVATTIPSLRTKEVEIISESVTNDDARTQTTGYLNQGNNPLVFLALGCICCIFLFVWGRKRRVSVISSAGTSDGTSSKGLKVQYTQVPDEQPLGHSQHDDDEYCDEYEEDTFTNGRDNWDDWEDDSAQTHLNPFAAAPSASHLIDLRRSTPSSYKLTQPLPPPMLQHAQLQDGIVAVKGDVQVSSAESNSSSDSFEVVTDVANTPPRSSSEKESFDSVDNLFSQFGMVLPFKKGVIVPPPTAAAVSQPAATAAAASVSSLPTAAEASALFAAEMDDEVSAVDAADEWGEDDEWVKGI